MWWLSCARTELTTNLKKTDSSFLLGLSGNSNKIKYCMMTTGHAIAL